MEFADLDLIDRPPAFPIYSFGSFVPPDYEPGRIVLPGMYRNAETGTIDYGIIDDLGPNDIVFIPLYVGDAGYEFGVHSSEIDNRIRGHDDNLALISIIAPNVKAILIGNAGPELSFKQQWIERHSRSSIRIPRRWMVDQMCEFMCMTSDIVQNAGGRAAYGPVDWDVAIDCYYGDGAYRNLSNEIGAIQIVFCGFQLFGLGSRSGYEAVPHPSDRFFWPTCPTMEEHPWPIITDYIGGYDYIISGVDSLAGLRSENDVVLKEHGFDAGVCAGLTT